MSVLGGIVIGAALVVVALIARTRLASFMAQKPGDYTDGPRFDIREKFNGPLVCEGVMYGPTGRVVSRFVADFEASWNGNIGTMVEKFRYDSGLQQDRCWTLTLSNDGTIKAEAPDVIGAGVGQQQGSAIVLNYRIKLAKEAGGHALDVTDWMYLTSNGSIMNRSQFRKFGIKVAELVATMRPRDQAYAGE
ncbi:MULTISPECIES: DUF3833 family protein [unclassified Yoonia]|uniref:DUF3833 family protein n=1 Tax=unclassified Yoonia TaxID=2629118 RepID=UPI002AFFD511|nr:MULTISPECIES: DUF3833 family protein [unclassified Yoonia]